MVVVRCTSKLLTRLRTAIDAPATSTGLLGDWYATVLHARRQFVLAIASRTLQPIVVTGRDLQSFPTRMSTTLADVLAAYGVPALKIENEQAALSEVQFAKTDDRSTVGVLTEFQRLLHGDLEYVPHLTLTELSLRLAQTPVVARDLFPAEETCRLFGVPPVRHRERDLAN